MAYVNSVSGDHWDTGELIKDVCDSVRMIFVVSAGDGGEYISTRINQPSLGLGHKFLTYMQGTDVYFSSMP